MVGPTIVEDAYNRVGVPNPNPTPLQPFSTITDVTGSRVLGNVYQNTSGKTMLVIATLRYLVQLAGDVADSDVYVDSVNPPLNFGPYTYYQVTGAPSELDKPMTFIVPAGYFYMIVDSSSGTGSISISIWQEIV